MKHSLLAILLVASVTVAAARTPNPGPKPAPKPCPGVIVAGACLSKAM